MPCIEPALAHHTVQITLCHAFDRAQLSGCRSVAELRNELDDAVTNHTINGFTEVLLAAYKEAKSEPRRASHLCLPEMADHMSTLLCHAAAAARGSACNSGAMHAWVLVIGGLLRAHVALPTAYNAFPTTRWGFSSPACCAAALAAVQLLLLPGVEQQPVFEAADAAGDDFTDLVAHILWSTGDAATTSACDALPPSQLQQLTSSALHAAALVAKAPATSPKAIARQAFCLFAVAEIIGEAAKEAIPEFWAPEWRSSSALLLISAHTACTTASGCWMFRCSATALRPTWSPASPCGLPGRQRITAQFDLPPLQPLA